VGDAFLVFEAGVLDRESRASIVIELSEVIGSPGRMGVRLHSIAFGNLKRVPERRVTSPELAPPRNRARPGGTCGRNRSAFAADMNIPMRSSRLSRIRRRSSFAADARLFGLPRERDNVANAIYLLSADEAASMKDRAMLVDGGEQISGLLQ
jgi:hypothetical protein